MGRCATENDDISDFEPTATLTNARDIAEYVSELSTQLAQLAAMNGLPVSAALLRLAAAEAMQLTTVPKNNIASGTPCDKRRSLGI